MAKKAINRDVNDPFEPWARWLAWLDTKDGKRHRVHEQKPKGDGTDSDMACTVPNPPGSRIVTVGDLRALVRAGRRLARLEGDP